MSERIRGSYNNALYKSTYTLLYFTPKTPRTAVKLCKGNHLDTIRQVKITHTDSKEMYYKPIDFF